MGFVDGDPNGDLGKTFRFLPVTGDDSVTIGEVAVRFWTTDHSVPTVASRWEADGRVLAYSADTGPKGGWMEVARGADLFLCEASYQGESGIEPYPHHLTATEAGEIARSVGAKHLMLTHIPPHLDPTRSVFEAEQAFDRPVALAVPGTSHKV
jgi:ribonuclease BN (tRNA processing enzyme)